jgi:hypothetical protein
MLAADSVEEDVLDIGEGGYKQPGTIICQAVEKCHV